MTTTATPPARRRRAPVYDVLHRSITPLTVDELADAANCSAVTVRRHLRELLDNGRAIHIGTRPRTTGQGRPRAGRGQHLYIA